MKVLPLDQIGFGPRSHLSALWWLFLLYREPKSFQKSLSHLPKWRQICDGVTLLIHVIPYAIVISLSSIGLFPCNSPMFELTSNLPVNDDLARISFAIVGVVFGVVFGVADRVTSGVTSGIAFGAANGIAFSVTFGATDEIANGVIFGAVNGIAFRVVLGTTKRTAFGVTLGVAFGIGFGIVNGITNGVAVGVIFGVPAGVTFGATFGIAYEIAFIRVYYLPLAWWMVRPRVSGSWYPYHPVAWDRMCGVSFPGLHRLLLAYCNHASVEGRAEIERLIDTYPSQRWEALTAKAALIARDACWLTDLTQIPEVLARLPEGDRGFLKQTPQVRLLAAPIADRQKQYDLAVYPTVRKQLAELLLADISSFRDQIAGFDEPLVSEFRQAAQQWLDLTRGRLAAAISGGADATLQVFRAGDPIDREQEAFVARPAVVGEVERQVLLATGCPGLILYGRRRTGKSTILRNFTGFLPSSVSVAVVSLQNPAAFTSHGHLSSEIARSIHGARSWDDALPADEPGSLPDLMRFLDVCDFRLKSEDRRLIVALDEYENIDTKIGEGVFTTDLLATLRESIQMHRRIIWILAGSHEIGELGHAEWSSYLVSARTVEVLPFTLDETTQLLTDPMRYSGLWKMNADKRPKFERSFWGEGTIERIHADAGGWPHLVQLLAERAVDLVNTDGVAGVSDDLYQRAKQKAIVNGDTVLRQLLKEECRLPGEWDYVSRFRRLESQPPPDDDEVYRSLKRRLIVEGDSEWQLRVPLMQMWLRERG